MRHDLVPKSPQSPEAGKRRKPWRVKPEIHTLKSINPDPGLEAMSVIDGLATELAGPIASDPFLQQMILRFGNFTAEGEGREAMAEYEEIDAYIGRICADYLRRQKLKRISATAFCVLVGKVMHVNLKLRGRGHEARRRMEIKL